MAYLVFFEENRCSSTRNNYSEYFSTTSSQYSSTEYPSTLVESREGRTENSVWEILRMKLYFRHNILIVIHQVQ